MPYTVAVSFDRFIENISLDGDHSLTARTRCANIVDLLKGGFDILEAFPTGSLVRQTGLKARSDADVFVVLNYGKHIKGKSPRQVLEAVREHLSEYDARLVKKNGQAVTLYFGTWPNVDIVPAARVSDNGVFLYYQIPDMHRVAWLKSNPRSHDASLGMLSLRMKQRIRMIKTWNQAHSDILQSFHIEVLALHIQQISNDWPWDVFQFFDNACTLVKYPLFHPNDASGRVDAYLDDAERRTAQARLERARDLAREAWYAVYSPRNNHEEAIRLYRILFGDRFPAYG